MRTWRHPGLSGALLYAVLASLLGGFVTIFSRLTVERQRGRSRAAQQLPDGPIIIISNHTSYADGVLLALACRRLGRSLRLLVTSGVFGAPVLGRVAKKLGFISVTRAPVVPVAMVGAHEVVGRRRILRNMARNLIRRPRVAVKVGAPIDIRALVGGATDPSPEQVRQAADAMMAELVALVAALRDEEPDHPSGVPASVVAHSS